MQGTLLSVHRLGEAQWVLGTWEEDGGGGACMVQKSCSSWAARTSASILPGSARELHLGQSALGDALGCGALRGFGVDSHFA